MDENEEFGGGTTFEEEMAASGIEGAPGEQVPATPNEGPTDDAGIHVPSGGDRESRRERRKMEQAAEKRIEEARDGEFVVRDQVMEPSGDLFFILSPTNPAERDKLFRVKVTNDPSADRPGLVRSLTQWKNKACEVSLVRRHGSDSWEAWKVTPPPTPEERRKVEQTAARQVEESREGEFFVRNQTMDPSGEMFFILSPKDPAEQDRQFRVKATNDPTADRAGLVRSLTQWKDEACAVSLVRRQGSEVWEAWKVAQPPSPEQRRKVEQTESKKIEDFRDGEFFVRNQVMDPNGEMFFILSPTNPAEREQQFRVKVTNDQSADRAGLVRSLSQWKNDVCEVSLIRRHGSKEWEAWKVEPAPTAEQRIIYREHKDGKNEPRRLKALEWTPSLDDEVDKFHQYRNHNAVAVAAAELLAADRVDSDMKSEIARMMRSEASRSINPRGGLDPQQLAGFVDEQFDSSFPCSKTTYSDILVGRQEGPQGLTRVFYNTEIPFESQFDLSSLGTGDASRRSALSALANFCAQKALTNRLASTVASPVMDKEGNYTSPHELAERTLVERHALFAMNPLLTSEKRCHEERELSEMNSAKIVRSLMAASGARAVHPSADDIRMEQMEVDAEGRRVPGTFAARVHLAAAADMPTEEQKSADPRGAIRQSQEAVLNATSRLSETAVDEIVRGKGGIMFIQREGGALHPPFKLEQSLAQDFLLKKGNEVHKLTMEHGGNIGSVIGDVAKEMGAPLIDLS
jgi:hypothetical protein